jgi:protein phosphatase
MGEEEPLEVQVEVDAAEPTGPNRRVLVSAIGHTDPGKRRSRNEDAYRVLANELFLIADGMGGYAAGEVASQMAVDVITAAFETEHFGGAADPRLPRGGDELVRAIRTANALIYQQARTIDEQAGMGTTVVAARFSTDRRRVYVAHVGDSRCYLVRDGRVTQLTIDHTLGALGIDGPAGHRLVRAVGIAPGVDVDLRVELAERGDIYLLCSDGLSKMVPDEDIQRIVTGIPDLDVAVRTLIEEANARGGRDNVSAILVRVDELE